MTKPVKPTIPIKPEHERITDPEPLGSEVDLDRTLRPQTLEEFVGQESLREQLRIAVEAARGRIGEKLTAEVAAELGLVTTTPDDLDWDEEVRIAIEERASQSPDALTGLEANLRFTGAETMETRIFSRLTAWQNWIFTRPNAVGEQGALKVYGTGGKAKFNWERI